MRTKKRSAARRQSAVQAISVKSLAALLSALSLALLTSSPLLASDEIAKAEGNLTCTVCHDKPGSKLFTDKGKYYELMSTLDGYDAIISVFKKCTTCHARKPGSQKLTAEGRRFARVMDGMVDLKDWAQSSHPPVRPDDVDQTLSESKEGSDG